MSEKNCSKCGELKPLSGYFKNQKKKDGFDYYCKHCRSEMGINHKRTKLGLLTQIYGHQRGSSKIRGHNMPEYSPSEFKEWAMAQEKFHELYDIWKANGCQKKLTPSADRTDDYKGYSLDRLQWMTWRDNKLKASSDRRNGINNKQSKAVMQFTVEGVFIDEYHSSAEAARVTKSYQGSISSCCRGINITANGFVWCYI